MLMIIGSLRYSLDILTTCLEVFTISKQIQRGPEREKRGRTQGFLRPF